MHLIYTRFWTKVMRDLGISDLDEPVRTLFTQGMVIKDGAKMSKSKGNVVDPDQMIDRFGADTTRLFSLFAAPPEKDLEWSDAGVEGCYRFLSRVWRTFEKVRPNLPPPGAPTPSGIDMDALSLRRKTHTTIRRATDDLGARMHFNTTVSAIMELINVASPLAEREGPNLQVRWALREAFETLALILSPLAPHCAEELWEALGRNGFALDQPWPAEETTLLLEDEATLVVQVNGKLRARLTLPRGASEEEAVAAARDDSRVAAYLDGKTLHRTVYLEDRLLNLVVS